jgi:hypothetical protein
MWDCECLGGWRRCRRDEFAVRGRIQASASLGVVFGRGYSYGFGPTRSFCGLPLNCVTIAS